MSNILVVDDDAAIRMLVAHHLKKAGYFIMQANNSKEALEADLTAVPDLLVLDKNMPGMDGFQLVDKLKSEYATSFMRVIMLTSCGRPEDIEEGLDAGADDYVTKPFAPELLMARVRSQLRTKALLDHLRRENEELKERIAEPTQRAVALPSFEHESEGLPDYGQKEWVREWPDELTKIARRGIRVVLIVCQANLFRSPMAELLLKFQLKKLKMEKIEALSVGLRDFSGDKLKPDIVKILAGLKINLADHRSKAISKMAVQKADIILVMENKHIRKLADAFPYSAGKTFLLSFFRIDGSQGKSIPDPTGKSIFDYRLCHHDIARSIAGFSEYLLTFVAKGK